MPNGETRMARRRIANAWLSSVISISLVLLLIGTAGMLMLNAKGVSDYFKESMVVSVLMKPEITEAQAERFQSKLEEMRFLKNSELISRERGRREMAALLGGDFLDVFESSPIPVSIELGLNAGYVSADSLAMIREELENFTEVDEVVYQSSLVDALNSNLGKISTVFSVFIVLLLFISFVLINNTMRLLVFDRRFAIYTMKLVGATKAFIRGPFLLKSAFMGLFSAFIAILAILAMLYVVRLEFTQLFSIFSLNMVLEVMAMVAGAGLLICVASTYFVVGRLVSLDKDELYG